MRFFKPRIQSKLIMAFLIMGFIPMILSTLIVVKINSRREDREIRERIEQASSKTVELISDYQRRASQRAKLFVTGDLKFRELLENPPQTTQILDPPGSGEPTVIWEPGRIEEMDYGMEDEEATQAIHLIEVFESKSLAASSILPVRKHGRIIGNLIVAFLLERHFTEYLENLTGVNIVRIDPEPFLTERRALDDIHFTRHIREKVLEEKKDYYEERALLRGEPYKALYKPLLGLDGKVRGALFFGVPKRYTFKSAVGKQFWIWLILLGIFMASALGYTLARRISKRINLFAEAARSVADGNLDQEMRVKSKDEIGDLASAFNLMTGRLRQMRELEAQLRRKDRLAALGELSAGVAHEIRNPLGIIKNSAQVLQDSFKGKDSKSKELSNFIIEEVDRLNRVVTNFLDFARPQKPNLTETQIAPVIDRALQLMGPQILKWKIKIAKTYEEDLPPVLADEELLAQVFLNLISNAIQAMPQGGALTIGTKVIGDRTGNFIEISFADTGCGIPEEALDKIFNPFFSAKEGGVGLGLSIVHKIVESHSGKITVKTQVGKGTTFTIHLKVFHAS